MAANWRRGAWVECNSSRFLLFPNFFWFEHSFPLSLPSLLITTFLAMGLAFPVHLSVCGADVHPRPNPRSCAALRWDRETAVGFKCKYKCGFQRKSQFPSASTRDKSGQDSEEHIPVFALRSSNLPGPGMSQGSGHRLD